MAPFSPHAVLRIARPSLHASPACARRRGLADAPPEHLSKSRSHITSKLRFFNAVTDAGTLIPTFRVLDGAGQPIDGADVPDVDETLARRMYENAAQLPLIDNVLYNLQRQGKISFYMTSYGEEATLIGSAAALAPDDEVLGQYRETGVLLYRGFTIDNVMDSCFGNFQDPCSKGRQMPMHFGSRELHFHTISSPLATQIPQAAGVGYALARDPARRGRNCAVVYFGEGAASEGDFHAGMLLASTIPAPTLFVARNNGFAISTPAAEQFFGDGIAARGPGYGMHTVRVDGNDMLAVYAAVRAARRLCVDGGRGVLVEAMTYRVGHHSTSDDSFAYRAREEVAARRRLDDPVARFRLFLEARGWWSGAEEEAFRARVKDEIMRAYRRAEALPRPPLRGMFEDVYGGEEPWNLTEQREDLKRLVRKYGQAWEPWRTELKKYKGEGREWLDEPQK